MHLADQRLGWSPLNAAFSITDAADGRLLIQPPRRRKLVIYGNGHGRQEAREKLNDPAWEVWALNLIPPFDAAGLVRADIWWDIHERKAQTAADLRWIAAMPRPIYVPPDLLDAGPTCVRFPVERIEAALGTNYWSCTFSYQIALALVEGFTDIGLYGVELAYGTRRERTVEWASVSYWMGFAEARGVRFHLPAVTRLGTHPYRYGLEYAEEIDDVDGYLRAAEDEERQELAQLDARRRGLRTLALPSVGG